MQGDDDATAAMDGSGHVVAGDYYPSTVASPRHRSNTGNSAPANERMRAKRSSSRMTEGTPSRHSDDESGKTAVKVAVRVRPPLQPTDPGFDLIPQRFRESTCEVPSPTSLVVQSHQGKKHFIFDRVFAEATSQQDVWGYVSDAVGSFVQGYNVSILAYGQSGAGKSYTMGTSGPQEQNDAANMGIVPRAAQALFEKLGAAPAPSVRAGTGLRTPKRYSTANALPTLASSAQTNDANKNWTLKATYVEIYNEQLNDLLAPEDAPQANRGSVAIREDTKGRILLTGLTQVEIRSVDDMLQALNFGSKIRQTDATAINARSSRSHAVFSLNLVQKKGDGGVASPKKNDKRFSVPLEAMSNGESVVTVDSKLHFVDLAGSERLKNTGATGDRAKEGISINAGLASLGKVISQLSSKNSGAHISYRDSRLTRLLQDSLGGNAITFMVACVTPASFHMNETLNTLHYAQRARAIQLRPEIQQSHEEGDKQAAIDRLRTEVSFLRDQIRHSDHNADRSTTDANRSDRSNRREAELQTQLMDVQENYNALSARHAKLISEISRARDDSSATSADTPMLKEAIGENAMERLKRSNSFAEAVESVVLEYEKTIQSLESSLSITRSSLSNTESTLLERETRITYMEAMQSQLQSRMQKSLDREQNAESYLRDLEARMEGATSGEENSATVISDLRKELAKAREAGNNNEEYIATLEERLAEAEQDQDIMQREIERLEQVVERQRSIGRLDNLLGELDSVRGGANGEAREVAPEDVVKGEVNGHRESYDPFRSPSPVREAATAGASKSDADDDDLSALPSAAAFPPRSSSRGGARTNAQDDFLADKLENVTQELFDLRGEHESVVSDYETLEQKYRTALETLARMEYDKEGKPAGNAAGEKGVGGKGVEEEGRPFLEDAGMRGEEAQGEGRPSFSRSVLGERSLLGERESGAVKEETEAGGVSQHGSGSSQERLGVRDELAVQDSPPVDPITDSLPGEPEQGDEKEGYSRAELETLRRLHAEQEVSVYTLTHNYKSLAEKHEASLGHIETLKSELSRVHAMRPASPALTSPALGSPGFKPALRRKSDDLMGSDRAARSFATLKNIALDTFPPDSAPGASFEASLNTVMAELHARSERVRALEIEVGAVRREMEGKAAIISGLTRERSSLKGGGGGVDFSVVGQMRGQLVESEEMVRRLREEGEVRERELRGEIEGLKKALAVEGGKRGVEGEGETREMQAADEHVPGFFPVTPAVEVEQAQAERQGESVEHAELVERLQSELSAWETKHADAMDGVRASEQRLLATIAQLEESLRVAQTQQSTSTADDESGARGLGISESSSSAANVSEEERAAHRGVVDALQREVDEYKHAANAHVGKLESLESAYSKILAQVDEDAGSRELTQKELQTHRDLVANLESQLGVHQEAVKSHQASLDGLREEHGREVQDLKARMEDAEREARARGEETEEGHRVAMEDLRVQLTRVQGEHSTLLATASAALGAPTDSTKLRSQIEALVDEGKELHGAHVKSHTDLDGLREELATSHSKVAELEGRVGELKALHDECMRSLEEVSEKERKSSRLVDELEEQLNSNFDEHRKVNNRLSRMETASVAARQELERELEELRLRNGALEQQVAQHRQSLTSDRGSVNYNRESLSPEAAAIALARSPSQQSNVRKSGVTTALPTPPPQIPLPPLPANNTANHGTQGSQGGQTTGPNTPTLDRATSPIPTTASSPPSSRHASASRDTGPYAQLEDQEIRLRTLEKHLYAEKQLTATLEEALVDLETSANRTKSEVENYRKKCAQLEDELGGLRKERSESRASLQAVEEEREMRVRAERARQALEQRMLELNGGGAGGKKKKKGGLNCF